MSSTFLVYFIYTYFLMIDVAVYCRPVYRKVDRVHYIVCSEDLVIISLQRSGDVLAFCAHSADLLYSVEIFCRNIINISNIIEGYEL